MHRWNLVFRSAIQWFGAGRLVGDPFGYSKNHWQYHFNPRHSLSFASLSSSLKEGAKAASPLGSPDRRHLQVRQYPWADTISTQYTPSASLRSAAPSEREPRRLRRSGHLLALDENTGNVFKGDGELLFLLNHKLIPLDAELCRVCNEDIPIFHFYFLPRNSNRFSGSLTLLTLPRTSTWRFSKALSSFIPKPSFP